MTLTACLVPSHLTLMPSPSMLRLIYNHVRYIILINLWKKKLTIICFLFFVIEGSSQWCPERLDSQWSALQVMKITVAPVSSWSTGPPSTAGGLAGTSEPELTCAITHSLSPVPPEHKVTLWFHHPAGSVPTLSTSLCSWRKGAGWGSCSCWPTSTSYRPRWSFTSATLFLKAALQGSPGSCGDLGESQAVSPLNLNGGSKLELNLEWFGSTKYGRKNWPRIQRMLKSASFYTAVYIDLT